MRKYNQTDIAGAFIVDTIMTFNQVGSLNYIN